MKKFYWRVVFYRILHRIIIIIYLCDKHSQEENHFYRIYHIAATYLPTLMHVTLNGNQTQSAFLVSTFNLSPIESLLSRVKKLYCSADREKLPISHMHPYQYTYLQSRYTPIRRRLLKYKHRLIHIQHSR